jgi:cyclopropane-fatty-acyl-phospholipid synthase
LLSVVTAQPLVAQNFSGFAVFQFWKRVHDGRGPKPGTLMLLIRLMRRLVKQGSFTIIDADGTTHRFGDGTGAPVVLKFHDRSLGRRLFFSPSLSFGEAFMDGSMTVEEGDLYQVLTILMANIALRGDASYSSFPALLDGVLRRIQQFNPVKRAQRNVAHHYDLSGRLYDLFLDEDRQYSCAYFLRPTDDLETAQLNKKRHIAAKLLLKPGMKVLDIGCGWGGMALYLARETGADVTGLTLSVEQHKVATERAAAAGLSHRVRFHLRDYRVETGSYDRIVSVGMFEHVGIAHYRTFFRQIQQLLAPDGVALLHAIGRFDGPGSTNPWLRKYIFPGGYSPALSEVLPHIEQSKLLVSDIEILRLHYAETIRHWRERFTANRAEIANLFDERFCRMWEFYLVACELSFRVQDMMVFQIQLARQIDAVPLTRDYMLDWERSQVPDSQADQADESAAA